MKKLVIVFIAIIATLVSCKKDGNKSSNGSSRTIRYEMMGNFTGTLISSYTTAAGGTVNDQVTALPWIKEITYTKDVTAAIIAVSGNGGAVGQKVTVIIKRGGSQIGTPMELTASPLGGFSQAAPVIVF